MDPAIERVVAAISADDGLRERVFAATSAQERAQILSEAGIELPPADVAQAALDSVRGGQRTGVATITSQPITSDTKYTGALAFIPH